MPTVRDLIVAAIQQQLVVTAIYQAKRRILCPHAIGDKDGKLNVLFFQFAGESNSGLASGGQWRCIHLDDLSNVSIAPGRWRTRTDYARPEVCVGRIIAAIPC
jgi:hypothetical protein